MCLSAHRQSRTDAWLKAQEKVCLVIHIARCLVVSVCFCFTLFGPELCGVMVDAPVRGFTDPHSLMEIQLSSGAMGYEPNRSSMAATSTGQCVVCRFPGAVEQLEATLLTFQTVLQGLMEQTDSVMDRLHEVEGKLLPAGPTEQRRPQVPPGVPVVHLGDDGAGGCGGPSSMGGRTLFGQPGTVEPPGLTPMSTMLQMQSPQYDDVRAAWDALKNLTLNKLEYNGRRSRAEQFNTWKDLVALQVQSLGRAGLRVWGEIWTKVDEAYQRHLSTPYMERSLVKVVNAGVVSHPDLKGRFRPLLMQAVPENFKRGLLMRGTITCAEILLDLMVDAAPGSMDDRRSLQQNLTQVRVATSHRDAMLVLETWDSSSLSASWACPRPKFAQRASVPQTSFSFPSMSTLEFFTRSHVEVSASLGCGLESMRVSLTSEFLHRRLR